MLERSSLVMYAMGYSDSEMIGRIMPPSWLAMVGSHLSLRPKMISSSVAMTKLGMETSAVVTT